MARATCPRNGALMPPWLWPMRMRPDRDERLRRTNALIGEAMERYVEWRAECTAVSDGYVRWSSAPPEDRELPFAAYGAALDREQSAAEAYGHTLHRLEQSL